MAEDIPDGNAEYTSDLEQMAFEARKAHVGTWLASRNVTAVQLASGGGGSVITELRQSLEAEALPTDSFGVVEVVLSLYEDETKNQDM